MKVLTTPAVRAYLDRLETILYEKEYFGFEESAHDYVDELIHDIRTTLPGRVHRPAPRHFDPEGEGVWYAAFRRSRATTWYVFFTRYRDTDGEIVYLVGRIEKQPTTSREHVSLLTMPRREGGKAREAGLTTPPRTTSNAPGGEADYTAAHAEV